MSRCHRLVVVALSVALALGVWIPALGLVIALLTGVACWVAAGRAPRQRLLYLLVMALVVSGAAELILLSARHRPRFAAATGLLEPARELYMLDRHTIQFEESCARYDARLGYALRPGSCRFENTEFDVLFEVNSRGFRDDEFSLAEPEIVVIGDSFAMGWGVAQQACFPAVLQQLGGRTVLNTGVSSYGTVRQLRTLEGVDLSRCEWLVIQFCNNDFFENRRFAEQGPSFRVSTAKQYEEARIQYLRDRRYYPGRYLRTLLGTRLAPLTAWRPLGPQPLAAVPEALDPDDRSVQQRQVELFLEVLGASPVDLSQLKIIVFELNAYNRHHQHFTPLLAEAVQSPELPAHLRAIRAVNLAAELGPEHRFILDDHLNAAGHRFLAERLVEIMEDDG